MIYSLSSFLFNPYLISLNLIVEQIIIDEKISTIIFCYEKDTYPITILMRNTSHPLPWISINLESEYLIDENYFNFGSDYLAIYSVKNILSFEKLNISYDRLRWDKRFKSLVILHEQFIDPNDNMLNDFFQTMYRTFLKNLITIFWNVKTSEIVMHNFNANRNKSENVNRPIFRDNAKDFNDSVIDVFMYVDPPYIIRLPLKYQKGHRFYFGGRDGLIAQQLAFHLNANIFYKSLNINQTLKFPLEQICPKFEFTNVFGEYVIPDKNCVPNNMLLVPDNGTSFL